MLGTVLKQHFEQGASLAVNRLGLGQALPQGYALMQTKAAELYWVNEKGETCEPILTNDARIIRRLANQHKNKEIENGMERRKR
jgi:hypothetical protein